LLRLRFNAASQRVLPASHRESFNNKKHISLPNRICV
jgi:hypothetical protein